MAVFIKDPDQSDLGRKLSERACVISAKCDTGRKSPLTPSRAYGARQGKTASRDHEADLLPPSRDDTSRPTTQLTFAATQADFSCTQNVRTRARSERRSRPSSIYCHRPPPPWPCCSPPPYPPPPEYPLSPPPYPPPPPPYPWPPPC